MGRRVDATKAWLSRGKLWDDVFTRTVSILLSTVIITLFLGLTDVIQLPAHFWGALIFLIGIVATPIAFVVIFWVLDLLTPDYWFGVRLILGFAAIFLYLWLVFKLAATVGFESR